MMPVARISIRRRVLGSTAAGAALLLVALPAVPSYAQGTTIGTTNVRMAETDAGDILADAVKAVAGADIGFVPAAAFKPGASAPRPATPEQVAGLVEPASDNVVVLSLRGDQILAALERSVSFAPQPSAGFLQVSGVKLNFDPKRDAGKRVSNVTVNGTALEASRTYKVAVPKLLANGQQGYHQIWDRNQITSDTGKTLAVALQELARSRGGTLSSSTDGRVLQAGS